MTPFLQFAIVLVIIIAVAKLGGLISLKLRQPSVLGELIAGLILGPSLVDIIHWPIFTDYHLGDEIAHLAEVGVLLLMFIAGLDLHLSDLAKFGKTSALAGTLGVLFPMGLGFGTALLFGFEMNESLFIGLTLSATSVSISAQTLMEMKVLRSRVGIGLLGAAVFDDILVVLGLSIFVAIVLGSAAGVSGILWIILKMLLFIAIAGVAGIKTIPWLSRKVDNLPISQGLLAFTVIIMLFYAWAAEFLGGMAAITGAFLAGLVFARSPLKDRINSSIFSIAYGLFVPIFFVNIGLSANGRDLNTESLLLLAVLCVVAIISKLLGGGLGALMGGFSRRESLQLGAGLISRGEVGLIVASVGIVEGLLSPNLFSVIVGVVIVTTLITPVILRSLFSLKPANNPPGSQKQAASPVGDRKEQSQ
jgi:Kef-type K+ transport system membrane component KefB